MVMTAGVRFKPGGKIYDFDAGDFELALEDAVVVESEQGPGFALVATEPEERNRSEFPHGLKKIVRKASEEDFAKMEANRKLEERAHDVCKEEVEKLGLAMNLFSVEATFDATKLTFFFTAEGRVDFRQLVKNLVKEFRLRIEMRQVGIRNQAKMCGGIGRCGREICCSGFIEKFEPVSIRMAKEQGLSLNPTKISGLCGRLMCCLTYENDTYKQLKSGVPKLGKQAMTPEGRGKVIRHNVLQRKITVRLEGGGEGEFPVDQVSPAPPQQQPPKNPQQSKSGKDKKPSGNTKKQD